MRLPPRSTLSSSSAASDVYKRQVSTQSTGSQQQHSAGTVLRWHLMAQEWNQLVQALQALHDPRTDPQTRAAAHQHCEAIKWHAAPASAAELAVKMSGSEHPQEVRHFGLHLVEHLVKYRWKELGELQLQLKSWIQQYLASGTLQNNTELHFVKEKSAAIGAAMAVREWPQRWPGFIETLMEIAGRGPTQADLVVRTVRALVSSIFHDSNIVERRRKELKESLNQHFPSILGLLHTQLAGCSEALLSGIGTEPEFAFAKVLLQTLLEAMVFIRPDTLSDTLGQLRTHELCIGLLGSRYSHDLRVLSCEYFELLVSGSRPDKSEMLPHAAVAQACTAAVGQLSESDLLDQDQYGFHKALCSLLCALGKAQLLLNCLLYTSPSPRDS
eukprot:TRINITY_DN50756_c0_g1_i1.p1 TRINITY_DN50756_c0_g1~~TRINITY_DN50756_c0_g1_i1.p1  ORF type:complete len:385 (-),score=112.45 TRINITY_DN50756_c0_g1_i1:28-1182(-)